MGCGASMDTNSVTEESKASANGLMRWQQQNGVDSANIVQEFVRLDEKISKMEATCPGPRMATVEAWIEHLQAKLNTMIGVEGMEYAFDKQQQNPQTNNEHYQQQQLQQQQQQQQQQQHQVVNTQMNGEILHLDNYDPRQHSTPAAEDSALGTHAFVMAQKQQHQRQYQHTANGALPLGSGSGAKGNGVGVERRANNILANTPNKDLANLAFSLGVVGDAQKASTHEDFFANLSESALHLAAVRNYTELLEHNKVRLKTLMEAYADLNEHYIDHDGIIAFISGGTYMSRLEESLDAQLETARDIRERLGSTMEQWRICGTLLRACANAATQGLQQWRQLAKVKQPKDKIQLALECRNSLQASLISLECAHAALPHVEIKHVSNRQLLAVQHCNTYMITDISNHARYEHTSKVFAAYESNMSKASIWLFETFKKTLKQDFEKAEETVRNLAKTLRDHREEIFTAARK